MTEAWWLRTDRGRSNYFPCDEHRHWIVEPTNARRAGVSSDIIEQFPRWQRRDRVAFLSWFLEKCPHLARVRNHGSHTVYEVWSVDAATRMAVYRHGLAIGAGPRLLVVINDLSRGQQYREFFSDLR